MRHEAMTGVEHGQEHGLACLHVANRHGDALIHLHGAHLTRWRPTGHDEVLWTSRASWYEAGRPIRGGVPICWPWFGPHPADGDLPAHGFARTREWAFAGATAGADGSTTVAFTLRDDDASRALWPHRFVLRYAVTIGPSLGLRLQTTSAGPEPMIVGEALHTYLRVGDVRQVTIGGLGGCGYIDKLRDPALRVQAEDRLAITAETDRIYASAASCELDDPTLGRRIIVTKSGSASTVIWNPWIAKAARMSDFGDDEWPAMACIETANVGKAQVRVQGFGYHDLAAEITVRRR